jgi:hypothetical protein
MADLFAIKDPWGDPVRLTERRWVKLIHKRTEIEPYVEEIRRAIEEPWRVYEGLSAPDTKVFYSQRGVIRDRPFGGCHVAAIVRYTHLPGSLATAYLPYKLKGNLGRLLYPASEME